MNTGTWDLSWGMQAIGTLTQTGQSRPSRTSASQSQSQTLTYGTGSGQADQFVVLTKTISATTAATYDLYTGTDLKDLFVDTAAGRKLKSIVIWVDSGGDSSGVRIGGGSQPIPLFVDSSDKFDIFPSGPPFMAGSPAGIAIGAATNNLRIENLGAVSVVVGIALAMTSS